MTPGDQARAFLRALWGTEPLPGLLAISWTGDGNFMTRIFETTDAAAEFGVQAPGDVYLRVCTLRPSFDASGRGAATDSWALPALVLDLDVKPKAFVDLDAAWSYLDSLPIPASLVVESGGGLHAWWVLEEPLLLDTPEKHETARRLADRWRGLCRAEATKVGADLDPVADLARVLRVPGTRNHKYSPARAVTLARISGERLSLARITALVGNPDRAAGDGSNTIVEPAKAPRKVTLGPELPATIQAGTRHDTLMRWAAKWRALGYGRQEAGILFGELYRRCEQPPGASFSEVEAEQLLADIWRRYSPGEPPAVRHPPMACTGERRVMAIAFNEFVALDLPQRRALLTPFLLERSLGEIYSLRGVGKTHCTLGIAYAVASGGAFLKWSAPEPARVLLVDGEMAANELQERLRAIQRASKQEPPTGYLKLVAYDLQGDGGLPSLASQEGQQAIEEHIQDGIELLILDNLSCLFDLPENDADQWKQKAQPWLMSLRRRGIAVLFIHHAGKSGQQRGTGAREDVLDYVIRLKHPPGYRFGGPARFIVAFEKTRGLYPDGIVPFEATLRVSEDGAALWTCQLSREAKRLQARELLAAGRTVTEAANAIGVDKSTVSRWRKHEEARP